MNFEQYRKEHQGFANPPFGDMSDLLAQMVQDRFCGKKVFQVF
jgi:hypothetical protein